MEFTGIGLLAKGYEVKRFDFLVQIEDKSFIPVDREADFQSLDDADATEGPVEIRIILYFKRGNSRFASE
ncbi:MAG: hypothetical protein ACLPY5_05485 [Candidatus Bathyarchaeia archaeon]